MIYDHLMLPIIGYLIELDFKNLIRLATNGSTSND